MHILAKEAEAVPTALPGRQQSPWQQILKEAVRDVGDLFRLLDLPEQVAADARQAAEDFPLLVPRGYLARMQLGDPSDPLLQQVLPVSAEMQQVSGFDLDPVREADFCATPGLLQKYAGRALMVATGACAVHCRYCFRRHFPYEASPPSPNVWNRAIDQIASDKSLREVILSGGDPLTLVDEHLARLVDRIESVPHVDRLRIHTRLPIVIPERVTEAFVGLLNDTRLTTVVIIHANHANELDASVESAIEKLRRTGALLLNQAVLLRGVNDSVDAQQTLCERLIELRVMPYYLHQLDRVAGASHFEVPIEVGSEIARQLRAQSPGYAVPRYVREVPGEASKQVIV